MNEMNEQIYITIFSSNNNNWLINYYMGVIIMTDNDLDIIYDIFVQIIKKLLTEEESNEQTNHPLY